MMSDIFIVLGLLKEVAVINVGLKVQLIHYLRLIMRTTLQLFFDASLSSCNWSKFFLEFISISFRHLFDVICFIFNGLKLHIVYMKFGK